MFRNTRIRRRRRRPSRSALARRMCGVLPVDDEFRMRPGVVGEIDSSRYGSRQAALLHCGVGWLHVGFGDRRRSRHCGHCRALQGIWLHVDAAYAGPAAIVPETESHFAERRGARAIVRVESAQMAVRFDGLQRTLHFPARNVPARVVAKRRDI